MPQWGNVNRPMQMGPIGQNAPIGRVQMPQTGMAPPQPPTIDENSAEFKQMMLDKMKQDSMKFAGNDPNAMICPACEGTGIKRGKSQPMGGPNTGSAPSDLPTVPSMNWRN